MRVVLILIGLVTLGSWLVLTNLDEVLGTPEVDVLAVLKEFGVSADTPSLEPAVAFETYTLKPLNGWQAHMAVAAREVSAEWRDDALWIRFEGVDLALGVRDKRIEYAGLEARVSIGPDNRPATVGTGHDETIRGVLDGETPKATMESLTVEVPGRAHLCLKQACRVRLYLVTKGERPGLSQSAPFRVTDTRAIPVPSQDPDRPWVANLHRALQAERAGDTAAARTAYLEMFEQAELAGGRERVAAGIALASLTRLDRDEEPELAIMGDVTDADSQYDKRLQRALQILSAYDDQTLAGILGPAAPIWYWGAIPEDRDEVARRLGEYHWLKGNRTESYKYFRIAYDAAQTFHASEADLNHRLAFNAAGIMKSACLTGKVAEAERRLLEVKERHRRAAPWVQQQLETVIKEAELHVGGNRCAQLKAEDGMRFPGG